MEKIFRSTIFQSRGYSYHNINAAQLLRLRYIGLTDEMVFRSRGMVGSTRPFTPGVSYTKVAYSGMISFPLASTWKVEVCVTI